MISIIQKPTEKNLESNFFSFKQGSGLRFGVTGFLLTHIFLNWVFKIQLNNIDFVTRPVLMYMCIYSIIMVVIVQDHPRFCLTMLMQAFSGSFRKN